MLQQKLHNFNIKSGAFIREKFVCCNSNTRHYIWMCNWRYPIFLSVPNSIKITIDSISDCTGELYLIGDGYCHDQLNNIECSFDAGDCCGRCVITEYCSVCECIAEDNNQNTINPLIGNGICNDETNKEECLYDDGDCCGPMINSEYCTQCTCYHKEMCDSGSHYLVGNHFCNDETNNMNCSYDGGDCCSLSINYDYCSNCTCYFVESCAIGIHPLVGDGYCNDETNIENCSFDGGDCCGPNINFDLCSECTCYGKYLSNPFSSMYSYKGFLDFLNFLKKFLIMISHFITQVCLTIVKI